MAKVRDPNLVVQRNQKSSNLAFFKNLKIRMSIEQADILMLRNYIDEKDYTVVKWPEDDPRTEEDETEIAQIEFEEKMENRFGKEPGDFGSITVEDTQSRLRYIYGLIEGWLKPTIDDMDRELKDINVLLENEARN